MSHDSPFDLVDEADLEQHSVVAEEIDDYPHQSEDSADA